MRTQIPKGIKINSFIVVMPLWGKPNISECLRILPDTESGLIADTTAIRQMPAYAVGLMKGENWEGNEGHGLVHRSPQPTAVRPRRLLLTLDIL